MSEISPRAYADRSVDAIIGENVHRLMWRNGDTQLGMAPLIGITQGALSNKLKSKRPWFAAEIDAVAARYHVTHGDLFDPAFTPESPTDVPPTGVEPATYGTKVGEIVSLVEARARRAARAEAAA